MKKTKIIIAIIFFTKFTTYSQPYQSIFGDSSTTWRSAYAQLDVLGVDSFSTEGDTIVDGFIYKKIYCHDVIASLCLSSQLVRLIREDTSTGKVWIRGGSNIPDELIMDLTLSIGDLFNFESVHGVNSWRPVDSIYYISGKKYIQFNAYTQYDDKITFIEGIGPNLGFTSNFYATGNVGPYLLCVYKDGDLVYMHNNPFPDFAGCEIYYELKANENFIKNNEIILLPHPITSEKISMLRFNNPKNITYTLDIFDITGNHIKRYQTNENNIKLKKEDFKAGCYFYKLYDIYKNIFFTGKIIFI